MTQLEENQKMMSEMAEEFGGEYYTLFANCLLEEMDVQTAIYHCWNNLKCR